MVKKVHFCNRTLSLRTTADKAPQLPVVEGRSTGAALLGNAQAARGAPVGRNPAQVPGGCAVPAGVAAPASLLTRSAALIRSTPAAWRAKSATSTGAAQLHPN